MLSKLTLWLKIIRPQTLFASLCPVVVGLTVGGVKSTAVAVVTALCALSLQTLSNLINDYYDFKRGADKKGRTGPSRALAEGLVTERQMLVACLTALVASVAMGLYLVCVGGAAILLIGGTAILFAWLYTATSHSLSYLGIADIFVFLYYGVIATCGTAYLQGCSLFNSQVFFAGTVCGLLSMCVLNINDLRDIEDDRAVGKRTFPVRFGKRAAEVAFLIIVLLVPVCAYMAFGWSLPMLTALPALALFYKTLKAQGKEYNQCLLAAGLTNLCYTILVIANF